MKLAIVSPYAMDRWGGVQLQARQLTHWMREEGIDAYLVAPGNDNETRPVGRVVEVPVNASRAPITLDTRSWTQTIEAVREADVVHIHEPFVPLVGPAALAAGRPAVATFHADPSKLVRLGYRHGSGVWRRLLRQARAVAVSPVAASAIRPFTEPDVIPNAIDVSRYTVGPDRQPARVVFVGRDDPRKGLDVLLEAWPIIRRRTNGAELRVIGTERVHAPAGVTYLGRVDEARKREELGAAAILCAPNTLGESFGLVLTEGMASGCAVVATALPAFASVLGDTGVLVPRWDVEAMAEAIAELILHPDNRTQLARAGRERVRMFDRSAVVPRYLELYERAVAHSR